MYLLAAPQVIQEVFCWTRLPMEVRRLAARKEDLFREALGGAPPATPPGALLLLDLLQKHNVRLCPAPPAPPYPAPPNSSPRGKARPRKHVHVRDESGLLRHFRVKSGTAGRVEAGG